MKGQRNGRDRRGLEGTSMVDGGDILVYTRYGTPSGVKLWLTRTLTCKETERAVLS